MGFIQDFKEFREFKKGKSFLTNELYLAELGTITIYENRQYIHSHFEFDKYVIAVRATNKEVNKHLIQKYGKIYGTNKPDLHFIDSTFEKPDKTTYYKIITMNNKIIASANPQTIIHDAEPGVYQVVKRAKTLTGFQKYPNIQLAKIIDIDSLKEFENLINTSDFVM
jgi:hypothetical protein